MYVDPSTKVSTHIGGPLSEVRSLFVSFAGRRGSCVRLWSCVLRAYADSVLCVSVCVIPQALWRTNHGYDPTIRAHYLWGQSPHENSIVRYARETTLHTHLSRLSNTA